jgi:putative peptidoglycan lipid II flippase
VTANKKNSRSLAGIAGIVAIATLISKVFGLVREQAIGAAFGIGAVAEAYAYAYQIPSFFLILLGGINGPFHNSLVSVLARKDREEAAPLVETITTIVSGFLLLVTIALIVFADPLLSFMAPGLSPDSKASAILQLRIMAPSALLAGLIGIGFGVLNASNQYWLPSISPLFSSLALIGGLGVLWWQLGAQITSPEYAYLGSIVLAGGTMAGSILQWIAQVIAQWQSGMGTLKLRFNWRIPGVRDVLKVMIPATMSSGMLQINLATALFFASSIAGAAAAMRYANFIIQTPLGIISNIILVPYLPIFSQLAAPENWQDLKIRIRQSLMLTALTMLPFSAIFIALATPIARFIYERGAFKADATQLVASLLIAYGLGMFFYLGRDVLVRVFYALGDGETPFKISIINIFLNAVLDYLFIGIFKAPGLILATVTVNFISMAIFLIILNRRLNGLPLTEWGRAFFSLFIATAIAGLSGYGISWGWERFIGSQNLLFLAIEISLSVITIVAIFAAIATQMKLPELDILVNRIAQKIKRK